VWRELPLPFCTTIWRRRPPDPQNGQRMLKFENPDLLSGFMS
jgi:hypothetical protein